MPETNPKFLNAYEIDAVDLQAWAEAITASEDHIVLDALVRGRRYIGFDVTRTSSTEVKVTVGRFYNSDGARFFRDDPGGISIGINDLRPTLQSRIVSIVAYQNEQDAPPLYRYHETDIETGTKVTEQVVYSRVRKARIEAIPGLESANPQPAVVENSILLATLTMSPAGIVEGSIVRNTKGVLPNLCDVADQAFDLDARLDAIEPAVQTIRSDLAKLQAQSATSADRSLLYSAVDALAIVQRKLEIPANYTSFRADDFADSSDMATGTIGYAARGDLGLRFPYAASDITSLNLFSQFDPNAAVSAGGLLLPKYVTVERRIVKGNAGTLSLATYTNEARTLQSLNMGRTRTRFGGDFEVQANAAFFVGGTIQSGADQVRFTFIKAGETYQVTNTGRLDAAGNKIYRVAQFWQETTPAYWHRDPTSTPLIGYCRAETFIQPQDGWCNGIGPDIVGKPASGQITVGICRTYRGEPDLDNVVAMATLTADKVVLAAQTGANFGYFPTEPFFLTGGERYAMFQVSPADYTVAVANADAGAGGQCFYYVGGGVAIVDPSIHLMFRLRMLSFPQTNVDIELQALTLAGGIQMIDVLTDGIIPPQTDFAFGVQPGGAGLWTKLDASEAGLLDTLPPVAKFRASFVGTSDAMPGIRLAGSQARVSRLAPVGRAIKPLRTLSAAASTITLKGRIKPGFDPAHHTYVPSIRKADGTMKAADAVTTTTDPDGTTVKVATFSFSGSPITQYAPVVDFTTDAVQRAFVGGTLSEIAA